MAVSHGYNTKLKWNGEYVGGLTSIGGVELSVASLDTTNLTSANAAATSIPGILTAGDVPISGLFDPADTNGQVAMAADAAARTVRTGIIEFPSATGATWTFSGFITSLKIGDATNDGVIPFTATLHISGLPVFALSAVTGMSACGFSNDVLMMPSFAIGTYEYLVTITNGQTSTVITPVDATSGEVITITANGASQTVATGEASSAIALSASAITEIVITISHATKASKVYTFRCAVLAA